MSTKFIRLNVNTINANSFFRFLLQYGRLPLMSSFLLKYSLIPEVRLSKLPVTKKGW